MADEFQAGVCAENWWMNPYQSNFGSSVCSPVINNMDMFSWPTDMDLKSKASTNDQSGSANNSEESIVLQDAQKPLNQDSVDGNLLSVNSTLEMMDNGLSSSVTTDWNHTLFHESKRNECNYQGSLQHSSNHQQAAGVNRFSQIKKDWSPENFSATSLDAYKGPTNQGFPVSSSSYGYASSLIQTLFDTDSDQDSIFGNRSMDYPDLSIVCQEKFNGFTSSSSSSSSSSVKPSPVLPKQQPLSHLNSQEVPPWSASNNGLFTPLQSQFLSPKFEEKLSTYPNLSVKPRNERIRDVSTVVKNNSSTIEPVFKRPRIETPSPLPTFKVRKEKLGDRVTALQQLVSPFGKTDTASVLHEAIEYIKILHDQVNVLMNPYMKKGSPIPHEQTVRDSKRTDQELRNRGLCLVPVSSTFPVASETSADFWAPTRGGNLR